MPSTFVMTTFQFHKGTIRTQEVGDTYIENSHFNSIKVRLELNRLINAIVSREFQFHKGTIRTVEDTDVVEHRKISIP